MWLVAVVCVLIALGLLVGLAVAMGPPQPAPMPGQVVYLYGPF